MANQGNIEDLRNELQINNRLMMLQLIRQGLRQKDIAATIGVSEGGLSKMFAKGVLKRAAQLSKSRADEVDV